MAELLDHYQGDKGYDTNAVRQKIEVPADEFYPMAGRQGSRARTSLRGLTPARRI